MSNPNGRSPQDSYLKTKKKGNVTVNPKKEDLMSELFTKNLRNALQEIKEKATTAAKETKQKVKPGTAAAKDCLLYTSPSPRDPTKSRMPSSA